MKWIALAVFLVGCAEGSATTMKMPDAGGAVDTGMPMLDPNIPAICQDDAWPDCPDGVFAFSKFNGGDEWHTDKVTCSTPKTCTTCQYLAPGDYTCGSDARLFNGKCKAKTMGGTCDVPFEAPSPGHTVYCISDRQYFGMCPGSP